MVGVELETITNELAVTSPKFYFLELYWRTKTPLVQSSKNTVNRLMSSSAKNVQRTLTYPSSGLAHQRLF
jgi:hypothetical protein